MLKRQSSYEIKRERRASRSQSSGASTVKNLYGRIAAGDMQGLTSSIWSEMPPVRSVTIYGKT